MNARECHVAGLFRLRMHDDPVPGYLLPTEFIAIVLSTEKFLIQFFYPPVDRLFLQFPNPDKKIALKSV